MNMANKNLFKSIADFINRKSYMGVISGNLPSSTNWGTSDYLNANEISLYTNKALAKRSEKVGEIEFIVKNKNGETMENHDLLTLLNYPNEVLSGPAFWSLYQTYMDLLGSAYILKESTREIFEASKLTGLHLLRPDLVKPVIGTDGYISHFEYSGGGQAVRYEKDQIIYIYRPDPKRPLQGVSLLKSGITAIQTEVQISAYHSRVLENGGKVEGVFKFKTPRITKQQLAQLKDEYTQEIGDARKAGTPLFLGGDAEYSRLGLTPDELSYLEAKKATLEDIIIMTGVPKPMLGSFNDIQYSNADVAVRMFIRETIVPLLNSLTVALDTSLLADKEETLTFVDPTPENVDDKIKETESGLKNYYMTINEARNRHGLEDVADGDVILIPFNLIPLGEQSTMQEPTATPPAEEEPKPEEEPKKRLKTMPPHPLRDAGVRKAYGDIQNKRIDRRSVPFKKEINKYLNEQRDRILNKLEPTKTRVFRKKGLFDEIIQLELEVKIGKEKFFPILTDLVAQAGNDALDLVGSAYTFQMNATVKSWMDKRADVFLRQINDTTFKNLKKQFDESFANGENRDQLVKRVKDTYGDIKDARAITIARTEVHNATQFGTMQGYGQSGMNLKIWVSVVDGATRGNDPADEADHLSLDGEEKPLDMAFSNGLMYPGDPAGSPGEVINCRCVI